MKSSEKSREEKKKKRRSLVKFLTGCLKNRKTPLFSCQATLSLCLSLSASDWGPDWERLPLSSYVPSFLPECPLVAEITLWDQNLYPDLCHPRNIYFWASFFPRNPKSFFVCHGCYIIYMQTAYMNTLHMQIEPVPWKFSVPSLPAARFGRPADTQPGHFIHHGTKPGFGSSLPKNHRIQMLERVEGPSVLPWQLRPFPGALIKHLAQLL